MMLVVLIFGCALICAGRLLFGRWFNPVTLYSGIWTFCLALFLAGWMRYYPLEPETWAVIFAGWVAFLLGCLTVPAARFAVQGHAALAPRRGEPAPPYTEREILLMKRILWVLNIIALVVALQLARAVIRQVGSMSNVLALGQFVYAQNRQGVEGSIPYFGSLMLVAALLGGIYCSAMGRLRLAGVMPLVIALGVSLVQMGRAGMLISVILFTSGYLLNRRRAPVTVKLSEVALRTRRFLTLGFALLLAVGAAEIVRSHRGTIESFAGASQALSKLRGASFITPSIYLYFTVQQGVLNQYLKKDQEHLIPGNFTFAPFWRVLYKLGFDTYVDQYQRFYTTPAKSNTGTYLRELHADWGLAGVVFGPFLLGLAATSYWSRAVTRHRMTDFVVAGHLLVAVVLSYNVWIPQLGYWLFSLIGGLIAAYFFDRSGSRSVSLISPPASEAL